MWFVLFYFKIKQNYLLKQQLPLMKMKATTVARHSGSEIRTIAYANVQENYINVEFSLEG